MGKKNIIVIGASAGGFEAIKNIVANLPADLDASLFIVWHMAADVSGILPKVLNKLDTLPAAHGVDLEPVESGRIYIAPPDHHLLLEDGRIRVSRGPKENRFRPAVDPLFRSAAYAYGKRVVGVILSGALDDGSAGLWAIKQHGGTAVVQDPYDAEVPSMPQNAINTVQVDYKVPVSEMASLLTTLADDTIASANGANTSDKRTEVEIKIAMEEDPLKYDFLELGTLTPYTCPECHGVLTSIKEGSSIRFRCHTGHAFSASSLADVLRKAAKIPVVAVTEKNKIEPNHIYVVSQNQHVAMMDGSLVTSAHVGVEDKRAPIDIFFRTLAMAYGHKAICVLLSGMGANGSMGLKHIKEMGGAVFVQNPREAEYNEMPRNAISTEMVDAILSVSDIPHRITAYKQNLGVVRIPAEAEKRPEEQQNALREIFTQLRIRTGHDFTNYKRPTLLRRIERRINVYNLSDVSAYAAYIQNHPEETNALLKDLLISVTNFFRDRKAFETLQTDILPPIIKAKNSEGSVRIWVAGCATGEEAYSLAMMCAEQTMAGVDVPKIQIFATDIDQTAINIAREGLYTINDAADVSPERLRRFFTKEGNDYRIRREIREMILFASHNILKDPPFSHLDMVSCRNVLIYLNQTAQQRVLETFHFALNPGGYLFLGSAESADNASDLFTLSSRENHIFQKRHIGGTRPLPVPDSVPPVRFEKAQKPITTFDKINAKTDRITFGDLHVSLVEAYAPPSIVVNEEYDIVHVSERAAHYLQISSGEPSHNLLKLIMPELRLELRSALYQAVQRQTAVDATALKVTIGERTETLTIHVRPVIQEGHVAKGFILVLFERVNTDAQPETRVIQSEEPVARHLEDELMRLKSQLRASSEQHELHAEELKASNEELQAMNEELRSSAEELETSKEELQSINEELRTVNQELKLKVEETTITSNNLQNLINSVDIGTVFLDRSFKVAFFTPAARDLFNLLPADYGRPLSDITTKLDYQDIIGDAEFVLDKLQPIEREVKSKDQRVFIMRVLPYRTSEDRINGVVITFINITNVKKAEAALRASEERLRLLIESAKDYAIFTLDSNRIINSWNAGAETMFGYTEQEVIGQIGDMLFGPEDREKGDPMWEVEKAKVEGVAVNERWHLRKDGSRFYGSGLVRPLFDANGAMLGFVKIMRELTESKKAEDAIRESEMRLRITLESAEMGVWDYDPANDNVTWNQQHYLMLGLSPDDRPKSMSYFLQFVHKDDLENVERKLRNAVTVGDTFDVEFRIIRADNKNVRWMNGYGRTIERNEIGIATRIVGVMYDITERKKLEQQKDEFIGIASHELKSPVTSIKGYTQILQHKFESANDDENRQLTQKLDAQVDRLTNLIKDLLDTTRIVEGKLPLHLSDFNMNDLIAERVEDLQKLSDKHKLIFRPETLSMINADRERIEQVLNNLILNAIKYSPDGGDITISSKPDADGVRVTVSDRGIGIPQEHMHKIFERFFRITGPQSDGFPGMGLGLYISAGIVQRHGGKITVDSKKGEGSVFQFTIPLKPADSRS